MDERLGLHGNTNFWLLRAINVRDFVFEHHRRRVIGRTWYLTFLNNSRIAFSVFGQGARTFDVGLSSHMVSSRSIAPAHFPAGDEISGQNIEVVSFVHFQKC